MHYVKASCTQVDSMSYLFNNNDVACLTCSFLNMPNVFTPNNDGINDVFLPVIAKNIVDYSLRIYSRWGQQVFFSSDFTQGWNGKIGTQDASAGVYYWICDYKGTSGSSQNKKGFLELIR
jgi:gliding motility-associated-like protein